MQKMLCRIQEEFQSMVTLSKNDALIMKGITSHKISLKQKQEIKHYLQWISRDFHILLFGQKPRAPFICIEPWYSTADNIKTTGVFAQKTDILTLAPKKGI